MNDAILLDFSLEKSLSVAKNSDDILAYSLDHSLTALLSDLNDGSHDCCLVCTPILDEHSLTPLQTSSLIASRWVDRTIGINSPIVLSNNIVCDIDCENGGRDVISVMHPHLNSANGLSENVGCDNNVGVTDCDIGAGVIALRCASKLTVRTLPMLGVVEIFFLRQVLLLVPNSTFFPPCFVQQMDFPL